MAAAAEVAPAQPAAGSSFYLAMRILPREQREGMYAVYGFCRAVDDIADDGSIPRAERFVALDRWRQSIDAMIDLQKPVSVAGLAETTRRFGLERRDFHAVIDGMAMDVTAYLRAPDWATLDLYCDRVASAVGRLSNRIFGLAPPDDELLAHHLGRALQLTNILRDLDEDAGIGRLYLPQEELAAAGVPPGATLAEVLAHPGLDRVCRAVAERAKGHFVEADQVMDRSRRGAVRAPRLMGAAYRSILDRLLARGWAPPRSRVRTSKLRLVPALLRYGIA
jgi:squalene synthase HpnD